MQSTKSILYESFIEKEVFNSKKSLAGFSMRKDIKHEIMFQKEVFLLRFRISLQLMSHSFRDVLLQSSNKNLSMSILSILT